MTSINQQTVEQYEQHVEQYTIRPCREIVLGVADLLSVQRLYEEVFEYECVGEPACQLDGLVPWWDDSQNVLHPADKRAGNHQVVMRYRGSEHAHVRLVSIAGRASVQEPSDDSLPVLPLPARNGHNIWDTGGIFGLDVRVSSTQALYERLMLEGFHGVNQPLRYTVHGFDVVEALMKGHDEVVYGLIERIAPPYTDQPAHFVEHPHEGVISSPVIIIAPVPAIEPSRRFFVEQLGFRVQMDTTFIQSAVPAPSVFGLPHNLTHAVAAHLLLVAPDDVRRGMIELLAFPDLQGQDFSARQKAPQRGVIAVRYPVQNLLAYHAVLAERAVEGLTPISRIQNRHAGASNEAWCDVFAVRSPSGIRVEFFECSA
jgi:catechol 2,3-dioxygenase-like lactoylglutathione lyase family enzyme